MKDLRSRTFREIMDMSKEDFDSALSEDHNNIGFYSSLRKLLALQYESMQNMVSALQTKEADDSDPEVSKEAARLKELSLAVMLRTEYKALKLHEKEKSLIEEITNRTV